MKQLTYMKAHVLSVLHDELLAALPALQGDAVLGARMFEADFWVEGARKRTGLEFRWRPGPASVKFETIRLTNERLGQGVEEEDLAAYEAKVEREFPPELAAWLEHGRLGAARATA